jgi:DNA-binding response OmpR family regulator
MASGQDRPGDAVRAESLRGISVLLVEDEFLIAEEYEEALQAIGVRSVVRAGNIARAAVAIANVTFDGAVVDIGLGNEKADGLIRSLRGIRTPVLIVTAFSPGKLALDLQELPVLIKPAHPDDVARTLLDMIRYRNG